LTFDARRTLLAEVLARVVPDGGFFGALETKGARMPTTVTINAVQREVFYELVLDHLSGIADLSLAVEREDFAMAERLGIEFGEDLRLMEDLGWDKAPREDAELTMSPEDLAEVLTRLKGDAEGGLSESAYGRCARETDARAKHRYRLALDTCDGLLHLIGHHAEELQ
jgi:hypothetical protein